MTGLIHPPASPPHPDHQTDASPIHADAELSDAHKYASIALAGSGITLATVATLTTFAVRLAMRVARRGSTPRQERVAPNSPLQPS
jgi:hypothetical protein